MRSRALQLTAVVLGLSAAAAAGHELPGHVVINGDVTATIKTAEGSQQLSGRMNGYLTLSGPSLEKGARVEALNVALFGVDQALMTGREAREKPTGVVGFSAVRIEGERQALRYDARTRSLVGEVRGRVDMPQFAEMTELEIDPEDDLVELPTMEATLEVRIGLGELRDLSQAREQVMETRMDAESTLAVGASRELDVRGFDVQIRTPYIKAQVLLWPWFEIGRRLCVQPVRILSLGGGFPFPFVHLSGDGLAFGRPGANTQWAKADVVFTYRDWITLFQPQFSTFDSSEAGALLSQVDEDDCIEVFFVDRFSPQALWGGGATFGLGQASSKVISSDENADFGVDETHLAHELGHVLGLPHPPPVSSTNTLMCPSGFNNDNPKRNSQENENNLSNPLLTFTLKVLTPGPDCMASADCGPCP